jgi:hypothetical protein
MADATHEFSRHLNAVGEVTGIGEGKPLNDFIELTPTAPRRSTKGHRQHRILAEGVRPELLPLRHSSALAPVKAADRLPTADSHLRSRTLQGCNRGGS